YNPAKAAAYEKELEAKRQRAAEARAARQIELSRALILAQEMELTRLRIAEQQANAAVRAAAVNYSFAPMSPYPLLPALGAVFDSRAYRYGPRSWGHGNWQCNGVWYNSNAGINPFLAAPFQSSMSACPPCPPGGIGFNKGSFSFQVSP
ncbi:MAG: hypothetical protein U0984_06710, partial [Prosthecobacter sp.]|nr:hypothetical protein [Prosthecobacter sp.]